jgi:multiple sugar transport system substrate-binding protein
MFKKVSLLCVLLMLVLSVAAVQAQDITELTIWWAQWPPADFLQQMGNDYEAETGIAVNVVQTPWGEFYTQVGTSWAAQDTSFDMIVGDSQWVGQGVTQGHYIELTDFMNENGITETVTPATLQYYGEYPTGSGHYYAYPTEGDANGFAYRRDLFEDEQNMADFEATYGYPLAVPETWEQLRDIAEFFTRPALELYGELYSFAPPGTDDAFFQEMNDAFTNGQAAMIMNYFAFFPALDSEANPFQDSTGYFSMPAGPGGERFAALGGQGLSVNAYIDDARQQASLDFIQWFAQEEVQFRWAELGGYTCNINVLESEVFLNATPYNAAFAETMTFVKDFWNIPEFGLLLEPAARWLHTYVVAGEGTAQEALDAMAEEHDAILVETGVIDG